MNPILARGLILFTCPVWIPCAAAVFVAFFLTLTLLAATLGAMQWVITGENKILKFADSL